MKKKCACHVCKMIVRIKSKKDSWDQETKTLVDDLFTAWATESDDAAWYKSELDMVMKNYNVDIKQLQDLRHKEWMKGAEDNISRNSI